MTNSKLLLKPQTPDRDGRVLNVTPERAGWTYVGFELYRFKDGSMIRRETGSNEVCLVIISGRASIKAGEKSFGVLGERRSVFDGSPWSIYVPARSSYEIEAEGGAEIAVCSAPAEGELRARVIPPNEVKDETRGRGTNARYVRNILPDSAIAESVLVVEVITPGGHSSSYPPHKHDRDALPEESQLEEVYYHRLRPAQGFAFQRVYTDDRSLDETMTVEDGDCVLVPKGYHPCAAVHGYDLYYLNVMAGPKRIWRFHNDPAHEWILKG